LEHKLDELKPELLMRTAKHSIAVITVNAVCAMAISTAFAAGSGKNSVNHRGGKAAEHMSSKGSANTNAQWSADPEKGWVRADERHELAEKNRTPGGTGHSGKQKGKGKADKF
jgi:hypothetical protein